MSAARTLSIASFDFDVPSDWYPIPLFGPGAEVTSPAWARSVVADVQESVDDPGEPGAVAEELAGLRDYLLRAQNPWLSAAVSIRAEFALTIGCLLTAEQAAMDSDDDADAFEAMLREGASSLAPGARSRGLEIWRDSVPAGELVGMFQRIDFIELGAAEGHVEERTVFGVFPPGSNDMVRMTFTTADLAAFAEMPRETQQIVATLDVQLEDAE